MKLPSVNVGVVMCPEPHIDLLVSRLSVIGAVRG